jgi:hypothetical protein
MSTMDRDEGDRFRTHDPTLRPGEEPEPEEAPVEGGGSQGVADLGARGTRSGGGYGAGDTDDPRHDEPDAAA